MRAFLTALATAIGLAACTAACDAAAGCTITVPGTVTIGNYDPTIVNAPAMVTFGLSYVCAPGAPATNLTITAGLGISPSGSTFDKRTMKAGGTDALSYWLYPPGYSMTPHSSSNVWGDGTGGSRVWGPFNPVNGTVYNGTAGIQVDSNQDVAAGSYSDAVVFTMTFV